jgi:hypothetical protein
MELDMKRKSGCASFLLVIVGLWLFTVGLDWLRNTIDRARFPWGYTSPGRSTLAGTWVGPIVSGGGQHLAMLVEMGLAPLDRGRRRPPIIRTRRTNWLEGRALVCARPGRIQRLTFDGEPDDAKTASRFHLAFRTADSVPPDGLSPSHAQGRWSGGDSLGLAQSLYLRRGQSAITNSADPDTKGDTPATLVRGTEAEFNALCNRLR